MYPSDKDTNIPLNTKAEMKPVLLHLRVECVEQLDTLARFYGKTRLCIIREIINKGIKDLTDSYAAHKQELNEVKRIFDEMDHRAIEREQKAKAFKAKWEDSY